MKAKLVRESLNETSIERPEGLRSRGTTDKILQFIADAGAEGVRYIDIVKVAYEEKNGEGSFNPTANRGFWSGGFKTPSRDDRSWGHLMKYIQKNEKGRWVLRNERMSQEEEQTGSNFLKWPGKTKETY